MPSTTRGTRSSHKMLASVVLNGDTPPVSCAHTSPNTRLGPRSTAPINTEVTATTSRPAAAMPRWRGRKCVGVGTCALSV